jgi:hypothetical protein
MRMPGASEQAASTGSNPAIPHRFKWLFDKNCMGF